MEIHRSVADDGVVTLALDDGAKNALDVPAFEAIDDAFDGCADAPAIVLTGREGILSAGLNIKAMAGMDRDGLHELLTVFGRVIMRMWLEPRPTVCAAPGHAIAAGTMLAMACDHAVAAEGPYKWGLTETQIDFEMPRFGLALARANVRADRLEDLVLPGRAIEAAAAVEAGYADELAPVDEVLARAQAHASELAQLPRGAYAGTKRRLRQEAADRVLAGLDDDIASLLQGR